jgi:hypothetical protein
MHLFFPHAANARQLPLLLLDVDVNMHGHAMELMHCALRSDQLFHKRYKPLICQAFVGLQV